MKKQLFYVSSILLAGSISAQVATKTTKLTKIPVSLSNKAMPSLLKNVGYEAAQSNAANNVNTPLKQTNAKTAATTESIVGTTYYDLQTNSSVGDRIVVNADGSVATCWTMSQDNSGAGTYLDRGTGYNYFNGTSWGPQPTARIESSRVGWGNVANTKTGKELILGHDGDANAAKLSTRATKGTGAFTQSTTTYSSATSAGNFWPRMVTKGDTVYVIALTYFTTGGIPYGGMEGAVVFSRSTDGGATWDINNVIPDGLTSADYRGHGGDAYAITAKDNVVAIVAGSEGKNITLSKSLDGGVTWTATTVLKFPFPKWNPATTPTDINSDGIVDTIESNDGSLAIALDNFNQAHVFYGRMRVKSAEPLSSTGGFNYFPGTDGLMMWNELMPANTFTGGVLVATIEDLYQQGVIYFPPTPSAAESPWGSWGSSLTSYPSAAFDASNTLYLSYSSIVDSLAALTSNSTYKLVRHVYVKKSTDGGMTWTNPCDVVGLPQGIPYEGMFASMAKKVDGNVHLIYQRDLAPGNGIPPVAGAAANEDQSDNTGMLNDIVYLKIPVGDIGSCVPLLQSINEVASAVSNLSFYPNPTSTNGTISLSLTEGAKVNIVVLNAVGQTVYSTSVLANAGSNKVDVNLSNLSSGLYFYQVQVANKKAVTQKFVIEK